MSFAADAGHYDNIPVVDFPHQRMTETTGVASGDITGDNLIENPNFEGLSDLLQLKALSDYNTPGEWAGQCLTGCEISPDYAIPEIGGNGVKITTEANNSNQSVFKRFQLAGGKYYYLSYWIKVDSGDASKYQFRFGLYPELKTPVSSVSYMFMMPLGTYDGGLGDSWKQYQFIFSIPEADPAMFFDVRGVYGDRAATATFEETGFELYEFSVTDRTEPPEMTGDSGIKMELNGQPMTVPVPAVMLNDKVLVPVRPIFEAMGMAVSWDADTQTVTATGNGNTAVMTVGSADATVNREDAKIGSPAQIINGATMVPPAFMAKAAGCKVNWDFSVQTVFITTQ